MEIKRSGSQPSGKGPVEYFTGAVLHPFYTDLQRVAWHSGYVMSKDVARLRRPDRTELLQPVDRWMWNLGGVMRFGLGP